MRFCAMLTVCLIGLKTIVFAADYPDDAPETVRQKVKEDKAVLIDVRELREWKTGHLQAARHLPLSKLADKPDPQVLAKTLPRDKPIYLHCKSGGRCLIAADLLKEEGYDLRPLKLGYKDLLEAGFEKAQDEK